MAAKPRSTRKDRQADAAAKGDPGARAPRFDHANEDRPDFDRGEVSGPGPGLLLLGVVMVVLGVLGYFLRAVLWKAEFERMPPEYILPIIVVGGALLAVLVSSYAFGPRKR